LEGSLLSEQARGQQADYKKAEPPPSDHESSPRSDVERVAS
jgi:hypothetical protein